MTTAAPIRILLADDHAILRSGLRLLLDAQPGWRVVGEAGTGTQTLTLAAELQPDLLLLDLNMPDGDGLSILGELRTRAPGTRIVVLTMHDDAAYLQRAVRAGAAGYVLKKAVDTELITAIQAALRGEIYVHPAMTHVLLGMATPGERAPTTEADPWRGLSEREYDVLKRVALGHTNAEIAEALFLSPKTVETYRARGMEKLGVATRAQLVRSAMQFHHLDMD